MIKFGTFKCFSFLFLALFLGLGCVSAADNTDVVGCGPVALQETLKASGVDVSCDELAQELGTDESGTSMQKMIDVAQKHGTKLQGVESNAKDLHVNDIVLLKTSDSYHYTVIKDIQPETITIHNPPLELSSKDFETLYTGYKLTTKNNQGKQLNPQKLQNIKGSIKLKLPKKGGKKSNRGEKNKKPVVDLGKVYNHVKKEAGKAVNHVVNVGKDIAKQTGAQAVYDKTHDEYCKRVGWGC